MSPSAAPDVLLRVTSEMSSSERRVSPASSIRQLKARLEPITGIPQSSQRLTLKPAASEAVVPIEAEDEDTTLLSTFQLPSHAEIHVGDTRPASMRQTYTDLSSVPKYTMPTSTYESLPSTVLSFKKAMRIGRFDPTAPSHAEQKRQRSFREVADRRIAPGLRCRLLPAESDDRRGEVRYVGEVAGIPGVGAWVGVALDEPVGRNDGRGPDGTRYFDCPAGHGLFVRPDKLEVGEFPVLDEVAEAMQEL